MIRNLLEYLTEVGIPIFVGIPHQIIDRLQANAHPCRLLTPGVVRDWLRNNQPYSISDIATSMKILEYVSGDEQMENCMVFPSFCAKTKLCDPLQKGPSCAKYKQSLYLGTQEELDLFDTVESYSLTSINIRQSSCRVFKTIYNRCLLHSIWRGSVSNLLIVMRANCSSLTQSSTLMLRPLTCLSVRLTLNGFKSYGLGWIINAMRA